MLKRPLTQKELYAKLKTFEKQMNRFKKTGEGSLSASEVETMQDIYPDVKALAGSSMAQTLNVSCPNCIRDAFHVFISVYDRLSKDPHVTEAKPDTDGVYKADGVFDPAQAAKDAANNDAKRKELTPESEEALFGYLGIDKTAAPQLYLQRLTEFMEAQANGGVAAELFPDLEAKRVELQKTVDTLPPIKLPSLYDTRKEALLAGGFTYHAEEKGFSNEALFIDDEDVTNSTDAEFSDLTGVTDTNGKPVAPATKSDKVTPGAALNTAETKTTKQKAGEEKAKSTAKTAKKVVDEQLNAKNDTDTKAK